MPSHRLLKVAAACVAIGAGAFAAGCGASSGGSGTDSSGGSGKIRATYAPTAAWLPAVIADERDMFAQHGLDVALTKLQNIDTATGALGRQFDMIASTPPGLIQAAARGIDIKAAAGNTVETQDNQQLAVLVGADSTIRSFADLDGKTIGAPSLTGATHIATLSAIKQAGGSPTGSRTVEVGFPNMGDQLKSGVVDAVEQVQPFAGGMLNAKAARTLGDPLMTLDNGKPVALTLWATSESWARAHADELANWSAALRDAQAYIAEHPADARKVLQEFTGLPPAVSKGLPLPHYETTITPAQLQVWVDATKAVGQNAGSVDGDSLVVSP